MLDYWNPLKNINFPFETNGKLMILGVPILKHFRVFCDINGYSEISKFEISRVNCIYILFIYIVFINT